MEQIKKNNCLKNVTQGFLNEIFHCLKKGDSFDFAVDNTTFFQFFRLHFYQHLQYVCKFLQTHVAL